MSSFNKKGLRKLKVAEKKQTKKHVKAFYHILKQIDFISKQLDPTIVYNENNINDYVKPLLGRDLDSMERSLLLSKLNVYEEDNK